MIVDDLSEKPSGWRWCGDDDDDDVDRVCQKRKTRTNPKSEKAPPIYSESQRNTMETMHSACMLCCRC